MSFDDDFIDRELNIASSASTPNSMCDLESEEKIEIKKVPRISRTNGSGLSLIGKSAYHAQSQSYISTLSLAIFYIPVCPLKRYRVREEGKFENGNTTRTEYAFLWELPLTKEEQIYKIIVYMALLFMIIFLFWSAIK